MNKNNSTNIRKNSKSFLGMHIGTRRSCLKKKTRHEKFCDTVPLLGQPSCKCVVRYWQASGKLLQVVKGINNSVTNVPLKKSSKNISSF
jgi:hypothetical protein